MSAGRGKPGPAGSRARLPSSPARERRGRAAPALRGGRAPLPQTLPLPAPQVSAGFPHRRGQSASPPAGPTCRGPSAWVWVWARALHPPHQASGRLPPTASVRSDQAERTARGRRPPRSTSPTQRRAAPLSARRGADGRCHVRRRGRNLRSCPASGGGVPLAGAAVLGPAGLLRRRASAFGSGARPAPPLPFLPGVRARESRGCRAAGASRQPPALLPPSLLSSLPPGGGVRGWSCSKPRTTTSCRAGSGRCGAAGGTAACS